MIGFRFSCFVQCMTHISNYEKVTKVIYPRLSAFGFLGSLFCLGAIAPSRDLAGFQPVDVETMDSNMPNLNFRKSYRIRFSDPKNLDEPSAVIHPMAVCRNLTTQWCKPFKFNTSQWSIG